MMDALNVPSVAVSFLHFNNVKYRACFVRDKTHGLCSVRTSPTHWQETNDFSQFDMFWSLFVLFLETFFIVPRSESHSLRLKWSEVWKDLRVRELLQWWGLSHFDLHSCFAWCQVTAFWHWLFHVEMAIKSLDQLVAVKCLVSGQVSCLMLMTVPAPSPAWGSITLVCIWKKQLGYGPWVLFWSTLKWHSSVCFFESLTQRKICQSVRVIVIVMSNESCELLMWIRVHVQAIWYMRPDYGL